MHVCRGSLKMINGKKTNGNLYKLMGETITRIDSGRVYGNVKKVERTYMLKKRVTFASTLIKRLNCS